MERESVSVWAPPPFYYYYYYHHLALFDGDRLIKLQSDMYSTHILANLSQKEAPSLIRRFTRFSSYVTPLSLIIFV